MKKGFYNFKNVAYFVGFGFLTYTATSNIIQSSSRFKLNSLGKETELVLGIRENSPRLRKELQLSKRIINLIKSIENDYCKIQTINLYLLNSKMIGDDINSIKKAEKALSFLKNSVTIKHQELNDLRVIYNKIERQNNYSYILKKEKNS